MKNFLKVLGIFLSVGFIAIGVKAVPSLSGPSVPLFGIDSNTAGYVGNSTFTFVDSRNVPAGLTVAGLTSNGPATLGNTTISGNASITGTLSVPSVTGSTNTGVTVYPAISQVNISTQVSINPTLGTYLAIESTGAIVNFTASSLFPAISTATALNGQFLILSSTSSVSTVIIATGTSTGVIGDDQFIVISSSKSAVSFIFNSTLSQWIEIARQ